MYSLSLVVPQADVVTSLDEQDYAVLGRLVESDPSSLLHERMHESQLGLWGVKVRLEPHLINEDFCN